MPGQCIFCDIVAGRSAARIELTTDQVVVFHDINPLMRVHLLIVPRKHIPSVLDFGPQHGPLLVAMVAVARALVERFGIAGAYRLAFNGGRFQHVPHVHWHLLAP